MHQFRQNVDVLSPIELPNLDFAIVQAYHQQFHSPPQIATLWPEWLAHVEMVSEISRAESRPLEYGADGPLIIQRLLMLWYRKRFGP